MKVHLKNKIFFTNPDLTPMLVADKEWRCNGV
jgi:hypothetical protein